MKKSILFIAIVTLFSCSKSDNNSSDPLKRKWYPVDRTVDGITSPYDDHEDCGKDYLYFYGDNSVKFVDIFDCEPETNWDGYYDRNGNSLTLHILGQTTELTIIELDTFLKLQYSLDTNDDGVDEIIVEKYSKK